jgi:hypothetical protein
VQDWGPNRWGGMCQTEEDNGVVETMLILCHDIYILPYIYLNITNLNIIIRVSESPSVTTTQLTLCASAS